MRSYSMKKNASKLGLGQKRSTGSDPDLDPGTVAAREARGSSAGDRGRDGRRRLRMRSYDMTNKAENIRVSGRKSTRSGSGSRSGPVL